MNNKELLIQDKTSYLSHLVGVRLYAFRIESELKNTLLGVTLEENYFDGNTTKM